MSEDTRAPRQRWAVAVLAALIVGSCSTSDAGTTSPSPCPDGVVHDLGAPTLGTRRLATFEILAGPIWMGVDEWQPPPLANEPFSAALQLGPRDQPPEPHELGSIATSTVSVSVSSEGWSFLDADPGVYWLATDSWVANAQLQTCGDAAVRDVVPAS